MKKYVSNGILLAALILSGVSVLNAQKKDVIEVEEQKAGILGDILGAPIIGAWRASQQPVNCANGAPLPAGPFKGLYAFHHGGTVSEFLTNPAVLPTLRSPGIGTWKRTGWNTYSFMVFFNRYGTDGIRTGAQQGRGEITLSRNGDNYTATSTVRILDINDVPVGDQGCSTWEATRLE